jgi:hypothetical protein
MRFRVSGGLEARPVGQEALDGLEPVLEGFDRPDIALEALADAAGIDASSLATDHGWRAGVVFEGTPLVLIADGERWGVHASTDVDPGDAMSAARKLHGLLGEKSEDWELDR